MLDINIVEATVFSRFASASGYVLEVVGIEVSVMINPCILKTGGSYLPPAFMRVD